MLTGVVQLLDATFDVPHELIVYYIVDEKFQLTFLTAQQNG